MAAPNRRSWARSSCPWTLAAVSSAHRQAPSLRRNGLNPFNQQLIRRAEVCSGPPIQPRPTCAPAIEPLAGRRRGALAGGHPAAPGAPPLAGRRRRVVHWGPPSCPCPPPHCRQAVRQGVPPCTHLPGGSSIYLLPSGKYIADQDTECSCATGAPLGASTACCDSAGAMLVRFGWRVVRRWCQVGRKCG